MKLQENMCKGEWTFGTVVKQLLGAPEPHIRVPILSSVSSTLDTASYQCSPWKTAKVAQVSWSLPPTWKTWIVFWDPGFGLAQIQLLRAFGE